MISGHLPFTSKQDLNGRARDFILIPDEKVLRRQPGTVLKALTRGRAGAKRLLEHEFRPIRDDQHDRAVCRAGPVPLHQPRPS